jgi:hypothetical protein
MVSGLSTHTYEERLAEMGMTTLEDRRHQLDIAQVSKIISGNDKVEKSQLFTMKAGSNVITRQTTGPRNHQTTNKPGNMDQILQRPGSRWLQCRPGVKNGQKSLQIQETLQGPPVQLREALRSQGVGASDARHQAKQKWSSQCPYV